MVVTGSGTVEDFCTVDRTGSSFSSSSSSGKNLFSEELEALTWPIGLNPALTRIPEGTFDFDCTSVRVPEEDSWLLEWSSGNGEAREDERTGDDRDASSRPVLKPCFT